MTSSNYFSSSRFIFYFNIKFNNILICLNITDYNAKITELFYVVVIYDYIYSIG